MSLPLMGGGPALDVPAVQFSPTQLAAVIDYWDADDLGAGGSGVASWTGRKNGRVLAQATGANQPTVAAAAINGHKAVTLDGVNDSLSFSGTAFATTSAFECFVVVRRAAGSSSGANPIVLSVDAGANDWDNISSAEVITFFNGADSFGAYRNSVTGAVGSWLSSRDTFGVIQSWWDGTNHNFSVDGTAGTPVAQTGAFAATRIWVGAYQGASNFLTGQIAAIVLANGLTQGERDSIKTYLTARYATAPPLGAGSALTSKVPANAPRSSRETEFVTDFLGQWNNPGSGNSALPWYNWGQPWINFGQQFSIPVFVVPHTTPRVPVEYVDPWASTPGYPENAAYVPAQDGNKDDELAWRLAQGVPLPSALLNDSFYHYTNAPGQPSVGDAGVAIIDATTNELWEFWLFCTGRSSGKPCCGYAGWMPDRTQNPGYFLDNASPYQSKQWGSSATSISIAGAQISQAELVAGVIPHALGLDLMGAADWWDFVWPAQRSDGQAWSPIPEGTRFRLNPSLDLTTINSTNAAATRTARMIAKAGQDYGWIVWDKGGSIAFQIEPGSFDWSGGEYANNMLKAIPINSSTVQVVDPSWRP